jgi:hypothetical protein
MRGVRCIILIVCLPLCIHALLLRLSEMEYYQTVPVGCKLFRLRVRLRLVPTVPRSKRCRHRSTRGKICIDLRVCGSHGVNSFACSDGEDPLS